MQLREIFKRSRESFRATYEMHEDWLRMSQEMIVFLSVLHGRTHTWDCQVSLVAEDLFAFIYERDLLIKP